MKSIFQFCIIAVMVVLVISNNANAKNENSGNPTIIANLATHDTEVKAAIAEAEAKIDELLADTTNDEIKTILSIMQTKLDILVSDQTCSVVENKLDQHIADTDAKLEEILQAIGNGNGNGDNCQILSEDARWVVLDCGIRDEVFDKDSGLTWEQHPSSLARTWDEGHTYCASLGVGWEMPELVELQSLVDTNQQDPALPLNHPFDNVQSTLYWSSTTNVDHTTFAWNVNFNNGLVSTSSNKDDFRHVWCVRR
ncbi:MAG: DUF1566 domain-containing protein [Planctomycetes bacterium]|nr:DUF1566 domain-containing protein [Planctomycetota bacterium]